MATFDEDVQINGNLQVHGTDDVTQVELRGSVGQSAPLQTWASNAGEPQAQITSDGRLELGDLDMGTADALIEANNAITLPSSVPPRGVQSLGRVTANVPQALGDGITWSAQELELLGDGGVNGVHTALRSKLTNGNTGDVTLADLRAGDFEVINEGGGDGNLVGRVTGVQSVVTNEQDAYLKEAVGVNIRITDEGTLEDIYGLKIEDVDQGVGENFAIHTGAGTVHLGDNLELKVFADPPTEDPAAGFVKVYPRLDEGNPRLYAKDSVGTEHELGGGAKQLSDLTDVSSTTPSDGQALVWNDSNSLWEPNDVGSGGSSVPTGAMMMWPTDTAPAGWLLCYGQAVSRTTYSDLFSVIGTTFGSGDGSTTFNLPDLRGRVPLGKDNMGGVAAENVTSGQALVLGGTGGEENHTLTVSELPRHRHGPATGGDQYIMRRSGGANSDGDPGSYNFIGAGYTGYTGGDTAHNNMPPYLTLSFIIYTGVA